MTEKEIHKKIFEKDCYEIKMFRNSLYSNICSINIGWMETVKCNFYD